MLEIIFLWGGLFFWGYRYGFSFLVGLLFFWLVLGWILYELGVDEESCLYKILEFPPQILAAVGWAFAFHLI
jgi:hypothetical protein